MSGVRPPPPPLCRALTPPPPSFSALAFASASDDISFLVASPEHINAARCVRGDEPLHGRQHNPTSSTKKGGEKPKSSSPPPLETLDFQPCNAGHGSRTTQPRLGSRRTLSSAFQARTLRVRLKTWVRQTRHGTRHGTAPRHPLTRYEAHTSSARQAREQWLHVPGVGATPTSPPPSLSPPFLICVDADLDELRCAFFGTTASGRKHQAEGGRCGISINMSI